MGDFLTTPVQFVKGVGPHRAEVLHQAGVLDARDLLHYYPRRHLDRSTITPIGRIGRERASVTLVGTVRRARLVRTHSRPRFEIEVEDASGSLNCVWFHSLKWIERAVSVGDRIALHGKPQRFGGQKSLVHPEFDKLDADSAALDTGRIIPLYAGGAAFSRVGLNSRSFRRIIYGLFKERGLEISEIFPDWLMKRFDLMGGPVSLRAIHFPRSQQELGLALRRLKFEELFFIQLMLARIRHAREAVPGPRFGPPGASFKRFVEEVLPFELTGAQLQTIGDVLGDTQTGRQMNRLVQGDVGSGKTVVAVAAMMHARDNGYQSAFMAPTEILAEQHFFNLRRYLDPLGVETVLLLGGQSKALREELREKLASGAAGVAVGTHALIQEGVAFQRLGLAVVDEQHRFGVMQRANLFSKGQNPHMLLMTATPIPRSLAMTLYGDLDVSLMKERPAGRKPIETRIYEESDRPEAYEFLKHEMREGRQVYVVYPLVEESEKVRLKDAEGGFEELASHFRPYRVDLIHGRMLPYEKDEAMQRFKEGTTDMLVSTTVIEVGVDVANASVMLIEHAERFGLSQLHQLRGRVGRGAQQSYCLLMAGHPRTEEGHARLRAMKQTDDGFKISEIDLKLRGAGDLFGTKQSGLPDLRIADLVQDIDLLVEAREAAADLMRLDADLTGDEHRTLAQYYERYFSADRVGLARVG